MRCVSVIAVTILIIPCAGNAEAGLGSLLGKAFKTASAKVQKVMGKGTSKSSSKSGSRVAAKTSSRIAGKAGSTGAGKAGAEAMASASSSVIKNLGTEGAMIASQLSPQSSIQLGEMAASIAKSPHRSQWLAMLAVIHSVDGQFETRWWSV